MEFRCRLGTATGEIIEGLYVADNEARLRRDLEEKGLFVLGIRRTGVAWGGWRLPQRRRVGQNEFIVFNQELATLLKAGMPLVQSLDILRKRVQNPVFRSVLEDVHERVRGGSSLSDAFAAQEGLFPGVYQATLMAGEKSGTLEPVLRRYVAYVKVIRTVRRRTLSALIYPGILVGLSLIVVTIIMVRVVPAFAGFYGQFGRELPLSTRVLVATSTTVVSYAPLLLAAAAAGAAALWMWLKRPGQRARFDRLLLSLPLLGSTVRQFATSQAARTLATLLGGGIPLVSALEVASRSIGNKYMARELAATEQKVREGSALATAMGESGAFPDVAIKMVEVGESTGALQDMLTSLADFYDEEIETNLSRFVTVIEPTLLVVMGLVIAALLLALYMPIFQASAMMGR